MSNHSDNPSGVVEAIRHKLSQAVKGAPADFDEREIEVILRAGGHEMLAEFVAGRAATPATDGMAKVAGEMMQAIPPLLDAVNRLVDRVDRLEGAGQLAGSAARALPAVDNRARLGRLVRRYGTQLKKDGHTEPYAAAWYRLCDALHDRAGGFDASAIAKRTGETRLEVIARSPHLALAVDIADYLLAEPGRRALCGGL